MPDGKSLKFQINFFNYETLANDILQLGGGTGQIKFLIRDYESMMTRYKHAPLLHPVIILIDNDSGAKEVFSIIKEKFKIVVTLQSSAPFYHLRRNLYLVKTPEIGAKKVSCIENMFDKAVTATKLNVKTFNPDKKIDAAKEFGKAVFAKKVIMPNAGSLDFSRFASLLDRIVAVMDHYRAPNG
jgi:RNA-directed DNA polymerase